MMLIYTEVKVYSPQYFLGCDNMYLFVLADELITGTDTFGREYIITKE